MLPVPPNCGRLSTLSGPDHGPTPRATGSPGPSTVFAKPVDVRVDANDRDTQESLAKDSPASRINPQASAAFGGIAPADGAVTQNPADKPEAQRANTSSQLQDRGPER